MNRSPLIVSSVSRSHIQFLPEAQDDPQRRRPDIRKAKMLLGWEPVVSYELSVMNIRAIDA